MLDGALAVDGIEAANGLVIDRDDNIYVTGRAATNADSAIQPMLWKFSEVDGSLVSSFGTAGQLVLSTEGAARSVSFDNDQLMIVGWVQGAVDRDMALWRVSAGGEPDLLFDEDGEYSLDTGAGDETAAAAATDLEGNTVLVGLQTETGATGTRAIIVRLHTTEL